MSLANHHALDFVDAALLDTFAHLADAGSSGSVPVSTGLPPAYRRSSRPTACGLGRGRDHPAAYVAGADRPGVAFAELRHGTPTWLLNSIDRLDADVVLVTPHWGLNVVVEPVRHVWAAATAFLAAGATLVAGHSAHVFHGVADSIVYDLGDFIDDYATDPPPQ